MSPDLQIPGGYYGLEPHQDWPALQGSLDTVVVWVPLVDIDAGMNPLEIIPGSNRRGLLKAAPAQNESVIDASAYKESEFLPLEVKAGDVAFISCFTVHRSSRTGRAGTVRLACSTRYENLEETTFAERGYPTASNRVIRRDLFIPNFPSHEQVLNVFGLGDPS
jgi:ectoine hydroxylase-related dioxygenase (phytanoyl-CoA dioxygenase family)